MGPDNVPTWFAIAVFLGTGVYFLGRWEGWWDNLAARMTTAFKKNKENTK